MRQEDELEESKAEKIDLFEQFLENSQLVKIRTHFHIEVLLRMSLLGLIVLCIYGQMLFK